MRKLLNTTAMSLVELIVASILVVIVIVGIVSINVVLNNNNQDYGQRYLVRSETQAALNHMLNNASLAYGSAATNDQSIIGQGTSVGVGDPNTFCIHQQANYNGINSNNEIWLCYSWSSYQINWCAETYNSSAVNRGASSCSTASSLVAGPTFLSTAYSMTPNFTTSPLLFSMKLLNCLDDTSVKCQNTGVSADPVNNPEVQISGSVVPLETSTS